MKKIILILMILSSLVSTAFAKIQVPERMPTDVLVCYKTSAPGNIGHVNRDHDCISVVPIRR